MRSLSESDKYMIGVERHDTSSSKGAEYELFGECARPGSPEEAKEVTFLDRK